MKLRLVAASLLALALTGSSASACGPFLPWAVFTHTQHPDLPLSPYAAGELGVLQPTYARSYLCVAYRWLSARGLDGAEQAAAMRTWKERSEAWWDGRELASTAPADWLAARAKLPGPLPVPGERLGKARARSYSYRFSASADAFRAATRTLEERLAAEGPLSTALRAWALAQDTVFAIRAGEDLALADPPGARTDPDHLYQLAAVAFHRRLYDEAEPLFRQLATTPGARMRPLARYLAVRCVVRRAQGEDEASTLDRPALERAERELSDILTDPALREAHAAARRLQGFVAFRLRPVARLGELSRALRAHDPGFGQDLWDFVLLLDGALGEADSPQVLGASRDALASASAEDELADWVLTFQRGGTAASHAFERWRARRSLPWLVAALAAAPPGAQGLPELLAAAAAVEPASPAFATLASHRARLLGASGDLPGARRALAAALAQPGLPVGSRNALLAQRAPLAADLPAWLVDLPRAPAEVIYGSDGDVDSTSLAEWAGGGLDSARAAAALGLRHRAECFDVPGASAFNRALPLSRWLEALESPLLPARMRRQLALAGWTRALLLADSAHAAAFARRAGTLEPSLAADLAGCSRAAPGEARAFAEALLVARRAGLQPFLNSGLDRLMPFDQLDSYRENWWSSRAAAQALEYGYNAVGEAATGAASRAHVNAVPPVLAFLPAAEQAQAATELARLARVEAAPAWLGSRILAFARTHPRDPRVPEALHRLVRAVRLGASDARSAAQAREAFALLHRRYPASAWARRTKTWGT